MAVPQNQLQVVQTYQMAELATLLNKYVGISITDKRFKDFNKLTANLGDTVTFDVASRATTNYGLVVNAFSSSVQRVQSLICSQAANTNFAFTDQQFIFQAEEYMERFGNARILQLGNSIESDILKQITSSVVSLDPQDPNYGNLVDVKSGPYRFFGDGVTQINSFQQLAQMCANFRTFGAAVEDTCAILPMNNIPAIVGSGLNQFVTNRNNELATSWMLGRYMDCEWYESNLLPIHISGNVGNNAQTLTVLSTNDPTGQNITSITFSGASTSDSGAIKRSDMAQFLASSNLNFTTFIGQNATDLPVQFRVTADAASDGSGHVTVNIYPAMTISPSLDDRITISQNILAGMQVNFLPSHKAGLLISGKSFYMAMPKLPDEAPYSTVSTMDEESGASIRHYWGSQLGQNTRAYIYDCIWGSTMLPDNSMRVIFPL